jgi:hypothetical protein
VRGGVADDWWDARNSLPPDAHWPNASFKTCLLCGVWFVFPFVSGLVSRTLKPHQPLMAIYEGASAPALLFMIAKDFPL